MNQMKPQRSKVVNELKRIAQEHGGILQPETVVAQARPVTSPLHNKFEWNDRKAGHEYRLWQARALIKVVVEVLPGMQEASDVFVSLSSDRTRHGGGYRVMTEVLSDADLKAQMLHDALNELNLFQHKYSVLKQLSVVFQAIKRVRRKAA